jgi:hypothetical protein
VVVNALSILDDRSWCVEVYACDAYTEANVIDPERRVLRNTLMWQHALIGIERVYAPIHLSIILHRCSTTAGSGSMCRPYRCRTQRSLDTQHVRSEQAQQQQLLLQWQRHKVVRHLVGSIGELIEALGLERLGHTLSSMSFEPHLQLVGDTHQVRK